MIGNSAPERPDCGPPTNGQRLRTAAAALLHRVIRFGLDARRVREQGTPLGYDLPYRQVWIPTENGNRLYGWFIRAPGDGPAPAVAVLHGWGGNAEKMLPIAVALHRAGYAVLLFDARGHGNSDVDTFASLPRFAEDLEHALDWLGHDSHVDLRRRFALGHSVGAGAALLVASRRTDLAGVVSLAAFAHPAPMMRQFLAARGVPFVPVGRYLVRYVERVIGYRFDDIAPLHTIRRVRCPVLLVHGVSDTTVPVAEAEAIYGARASEDVRLCICAGGHDGGEDLMHAMREVIAFLDSATSIKQTAGHG